MIKLQKEVESCFKTRHKAGTDQVVIFDGFDALEKEGAVKFFSRKTKKDVLEYLQSRKGDMIAGGDYQLEEWSVLKQNARYYYLQAYLEFLLETQSENEPDEGYISDFFHQLYQTVYMYGREAYSNDQKALLRKISTYTLETVKKHTGIEYWGDDVKDNVDMFLSELEKYE